jgi:uncharacterized repeat protein (TIGR01451 family)
MGRRFLLILGILLLAPPSRAQDGSGPPAPGAAPASPSDPPPPDRPLVLPSTDEGLPPGDRPKPASSRSSGRQDKDGQASPPPLDPSVGDGASRQAGDPPSPPGDPQLARTGGVADGPAAGEPKPSAPNSPPAGELDGLPADRLPAGKQSVAVTVDVQSPPNMNLHVPAKVRLVIRNTGTSDALQVRIRDELPDGLKFISSDHEPDGGGSDSILSWSLRTLPAGSEKVIVVNVEPVKTGSLEHGATVWFQTGSSAQTKVLQPKLKIEQSASAATVLRGHAVEFKIRVTNDGDGPARNVRVVAKLGGGLRYGSGRRGDSEVVTDPIPVLGPGQTEELDPLIADAIAEGPASCTVIATSPDVMVQNKGEEARSVAPVAVVEPKLEVVVSGPQQRCTGTVAPYEIAVRNPGTAPARKVRVIALVPPGVRLLAVPEGARYDQATRRLQWSIETLEPGSTPQKLGFEVKVGDVGKYEVTAEALGTGGLKAESSRLVTEVFGMPDVDLVVSERQRVVDVGGKTWFLIRLRNYGTKEATNLILKGSVTSNLKITDLRCSDGVPSDIEAQQQEKGDQVLFVRKGSDAAAIPRLGPGKEVVIGVEVTVTAAAPRFATFHVTATHDDLSGTYEDMAGVKVLPPSSRPADPGGR